ncbi:MAG: hypothetical protein L6R48_08310 [Planctomycetes bacterium]|nr:hypothetical protein [Planctomycetota bacterium]
MRDKLRAALANEGGFAEGVKAIPLNLASYGAGLNETGARIRSASPVDVDMGGLHLGAPAAAEAADLVRLQQDVAAATPNDFIGGTIAQLGQVPVMLLEAAGGAPVLRAVGLVTKGLGVAQGVAHPAVIALANKLGISPAAALSMAQAATVNTAIEAPSQFNEASAEVEQGANPLAAAGRAAARTAASSAIAAPMGMTGLEALAKTMTSPAGGRQAITDTLGKMGLGMVKEGPLEEGPQNVSGDLINALTGGEQKPIDAVLRDAGQASIVGAVAGAHGEAAQIPREVAAMIEAQRAQAQSKRMAPLIAALQASDPRQAQVEAIPGAPENVGQVIAQEQVRRGLPQDFTPAKGAVVPETGGALPEGQPMDLDQAMAELAATAPQRDPPLPTVARDGDMAQSDIDALMQSLGVGLLPMPSGVPAAPAAVPHPPLGKDDVEELMRSLGVVPPGSAPTQEPTRAQVPAPQSRPVAAAANPGGAPAGTPAAPVAPAAAPARPPAAAPVAESIPQFTARRLAEGADRSTLIKDVRRTFNVGWNAATKAVDLAEEADAAGPSEGDVIHDEEVRAHQPEPVPAYDVKAARRLAIEMAIAGAESADIHAALRRMGVPTDEASDIASEADDALQPPPSENDQRISDATGLGPGQHHGQPRVPYVNPNPPAPPVAPAAPFPVGQRVRFAKGGKKGVEGVVVGLVGARPVIRTDAGKIHGETGGMEPGNLEAITAPAAPATPAALPGSNPGSPAGVAPTPAAANAAPAQPVPPAAAAGAPTTPTAHAQAAPPPAPAPAAPAAERGGSRPVLPAPAEGNGASAAAERTPEQVKAEARRRFDEKQKARKAVASSTPQASPVVSGETASDAKQAALAKMRASLMQLGKELGGSAAAGDMAMSDEQAGQSADAAYTAIEAGYDAGLGDFRAMLEQVKAFGLPFAHRPEFHAALEDAYDAFQEAAGLPPRGSLTAAQVIGASAPLPDGHTTGKDLPHEQQPSAGHERPGAVGNDARNAGGGGSVDQGAAEAGGASGGAGKPVDVRGSDGGAAEGPRPDSGAGEAVGGGQRGEPEKPRVAAPKVPRVNGFRFASIEDAMPPRGDITRARANLDAIETARQVMAEGREPTAEERATIARFSGWGSLKWVFNEESRNGSDKSKRDLFLRAESLMSDIDRENAAAANANADENGAEPANGETKRAAIISTMNAHFTNPQVVAEVWDTVLRLMGAAGATGKLRVLEPSMGMGAFIGLEPEALRGRVAWTGVELEPSTASMAKLVYADAAVMGMGFEKLDVPDNSYDLVISNVPFGSYRIYERRYAKQGKPFIHDFFFLKAMDKVRPGGLVAFITSTGTLDKADPAIRRALFAQGDLVHAVRYPSNAQDTAGTQVVTDLVILRKRMPGEKPGSAAWLNVGTVPDAKGGSPIPINQWFIDHPKLVLGNAERTGKLWGLDKGGEKRPNWTARPTYADEAKAAVAAAPEGIMAGRSPKAVAVVTMPAPAELRPYALVSKDGQVWQKQGGDLVVVDTRKPSAERVGWMRELVDQLRRIWAAELAGKDSAPQRAELGRLYDAGMPKFGRLNAPANSRTFRADPDAANLLALEVMKSDDSQEDEDAIVWDKGDAFSKPTVRPPRLVGRAENSAQGVAASMARSGTVHAESVAEAMGLTVAEAEQRMREDGSAFLDPSQGWQPSWAYLSGNVRAKLAEAQDAAARDHQFQANVDALTKVQPKDLEPHEITPVFGAPWIGADAVRQFLMREVGGIEAVPGPEGRWLVAGDGTTAAEATWSVKGENRTAMASEIVDAAINGSRIDMTVRTRDGKAIKDPIGEVAATERANALRKKFTDWMRLPEQAQAMAEAAKTYNATVNVFHSVKPDTSWITFDGMNPSVTMDEQQRRAVARAITDGRVLLAHEVGTGKTYSLIASAIEMKRLGVARKPVIATLNNVVAQFGRDAARLYPGKNILIQPQVWGEKGTATSREAFIARLGTQDYDVAIISHETLTSLPTDPRTQASRLADVLVELEACHAALKQRADADTRGGRNNSRAVGALAKRIENTKQRMAELNDHALKVANITFEQTGIDYLLIDEAHAYKNLPIITSMEGVLGLGGAESKRGEDLLIKAMTLHARNGGERGLILATGTPISNTMTEVFAFQQMMQPRALKVAGVNHFDNWARTFGTTVQSNEVQADGTRKSVTRFAEWVNLSGLSAMLGDWMDVTLTQDIPRVMESIPAVREVAVKVPISEVQKAFREWTGLRLARIKSQGKPEKGMDIALSAMRDAQMSSIDMRLVDPAATAADGSKVPALVAGVAKLYREGPRVDGHQPTQFIFQEVQTNPTVWGFSLNQAIVDGLVAEGIPAKAIAVLDGNTAPAVRSRIKAEAAMGKYAVLIGSTSVLGTGTNAQQYALGTWHIDVPHRPADIIQRDGRMVRQGNRYRSIDATVLAHRVITEGTMDEAMWAKLALKKEFIYSALAAVRDGAAANEMREVETEGFSPDMIAALASGDPDLIRSVDLDGELSTLHRERAAHYHQRDYRESTARSQTAQAAAYQRSVDALLGLEKAVAGKVPSKAMLDDGTTGKQLTDKLKAMVADPLFRRGGKLGTFAGIPVEIVGKTAGFGNDPGAILYSFAGNSGQASDGAALLGTLRSWATSFGARAAKDAERVAELTKQAETNRAAAEKVGDWPKEDEYLALKQESEALDAALRTRPAIAPSMTEAMRDRFDRGLQSRRAARDAAEVAKELRPKKAPANLASTDEGAGEPIEDGDREEAFSLDDPADAPADLAAPADQAARSFNGVNYRVPPAPLAPIPGQPVTKLADIIMDFGKSLTRAGVGQTAFTHAGLRADQKGLYRASTGQTAIRHNNLDAAAHEIAHRLDDFFPFTAQPDATAAPAEVRRWKAVMRELAPFSYTGSVPPAGLSRPAKLAYIRAEGYAEFVRAFIVNPDETRAHAPKAVAMLTERVPAPVLAALKDFSDQVRRFAALPDPDKTQANVRGVADASAEASTSKLGVALKEFAEAAAGAGTDGRKADIPKFKASFKDRVTFGWFDAQWFAIKAYRQALAIKGIDQETMPIERDYETLARLSAGLADRMDSMFADGLVDAENNPVLDRGQRMNLEWLQGPAIEDGLTPAQIAAELDAAMSQGVEERTVEEGTRNLRAAQREAELYREGLWETNPDDPDIGKKYLAFLKAKVREARQVNARLTGIAGGLDSDYEQARRALRERQLDGKATARRNEILRRYRAWADAVLDYAVQAGVMGQERVDALKKSHAHYIDLHRVIGKESAAIPIRKFEGSTRLIDNPLVNLMHATWSTIQWADRNRVRRAFIDVLAADRGLHQGEVQDLHTIGHEITDEDLAGKDQHGKVNGQRPYKVWVPDGPDKVRESWWVFDPAVEASFEAANTFDDPNAMLKLLQGLKRLSQKTITSSPPFLIRQVFRDTGERLVTTETGSGLSDLFRGYGSLGGKSVLERFKTAGGGQAGWDERGKEDYQRRLMATLHDSVHTKGRVVATAQTLARGYGKLMSESDMANRRAEFARAWQAAKDRGMSDYQADLYAAKHARGLIDFAVAGYTARRVNQYVVFFNAAMQSLRRTNRAMSKGHRTSTAVRWLLFSALPTALIYGAQAALMSDDDREEWRQRPREKRDFAWSFKVGTVWIDIPKSYSWGAMASGMERALDVAFHHAHARAELEQWSLSLLSSLSPFKPDMLVGSARPFAEAYFNRSVFTGRRIIPVGDEGADLDLRKGTKDASPVGQALQKAIGIDARKIDHLIQSQFGGWGRVAAARKSDPAWWLGAATGLTGRAPSWEATDVQWVMDFAEDRKVSSRRPFAAVRDALAYANEATNAKEYGDRARRARQLATKLRRAIEANPKGFNGAE